MQLTVTISLAHPGNTDAYGGHLDNKNVSGLGYYHYHCGGYPPHLHYGGRCPYKSPPNNQSNEKDTIDVDNMPKMMFVGDEVYLSWTVYYYSGDGKVTWSSNNEEVLSVTSDGKLEAISPGKATITAKMTNGLKRFIITVDEIKVTSIRLPLVPDSMEEGETHRIVPVVKPETVAIKDLHFTSSDLSVASVSTNGNITAISEGKTVITVAGANGVSKSFTLKVTKRRLDTISINWNAMKIQPDVPIPSNQAFIMMVSSKPYQISEVGYTVTSSNPDIISVEDNVMYTHKHGTADITVSSTEFPDVSSTVTLTVQKQLPYSVMVIMSIIIIAGIIYFVITQVKRKKRSNNQKGEKEMITVLKKILIWFICALLYSVIIVSLRMFAHINLGGIPTVLIAAVFFFIARALCDRITIHDPNNSKVTIKKNESEKNQ